MHIIKSKFIVGFVVLLSIAGLAQAGNTVRRRRKSPA
jgi:hypothetical protein